MTLWFKNRTAGNTVDVQCLGSLWVLINGKRYGSSIMSAIWEGGC